MRSTPIRRVRVARLSHVVFIAGALACASGEPRPAAGAEPPIMPRAELRGAPPYPRQYVVVRRAGAVTLDGRLDEAAWSNAPYTAEFTDIEGAVQPAPRLRTRVKMLWDDSYWYIGAELEEPDLWATIRERDAVIFHDNDFELFVDPDGDTHRYFELEINALGTPWDLFLPKPYRDDGHAVDAWNIDGLQAQVALDGTLNDPRDRDAGWSVELAIPWTALGDSGRTRVPPQDGDVWRVNFSRVEWDLDTIGGAYQKRVNPSTGNPLPEHNWVWTPQGAVNMHMPEMWGLVRFGGSGPVTPGADYEARWVLRRIYYAQREYRKTHGAWAGTLASLGLADLPAGIALATSGAGWEATIQVPPAPDAGEGQRAEQIHIRADGLVWRD